LIIVVAALVGAAICGLLAMFTGYEMMDRVNERLPKEAQFDPLGWYWSKTRRLFREYRRLFPQGRLIFRARFLWGLGCVCMLGCAWGLGFFGK
jgi:hypothetical protein